MGMLRVCTADGCETKTLGPYCIEHEQEETGEDFAEVFQLGLVSYAAQAGEPDAAA
jgi:hypothetical protein